MKELIISKDNENQRFDKFLMKYFNDAPKSLIYKLLRKKRIKLNGKKAEGNEILNKNDSIQLYIAPETMDTMMSKKDIKEIKIDFEIIYEDENVIFADKPSGLLVHSDGSEKNTLNDGLLYYLYTKNEYDISKEGVFKPTVCNRLDRNTSGIVTFGKNLASVQALNEIFRTNQADKYYIALACGEIKNEGKLEGWHVKDSNNKVHIYNEERENAKKVSLYYKPLKYFEGNTILEIKLITGKSHQIRAMLANIGHGIIGDGKYGSMTKTEKAFCEKYKIKNQMLHCYKFIIKKSEILEYLEGREFISRFKKLEKIIGEKI